MILSVITKDSIDDQTNPTSRKAAHDFQDEINIQLNNRTFEKTNLTS